MDITFAPDSAVDDASCKAATGKTFAERAALIDERGLGGKVRDAIQLIYDQTGRGKDVWWPTTIWVEYERRRGIVKKDGRPKADGLRRAWGQALDRLRAKLTA